MTHRMFKYSLLLLICCLLAGCVTPKNQLPKNQQCAGLKRQMMQTAQNNPDSPGTVIQSKNDALLQQYQALGCDS